MRLSLRFGLALRRPCSEASIEECVVDGLPVFKRNDPESSISGFRHQAPDGMTPIRLEAFLKRSIQDAQNPGLVDPRVFHAHDIPEVGRCFHGNTVMATLLRPGHRRSGFPACVAGLDQEGVIGPAIPPRRLRRGRAAAVLRHVTKAVRLRLFAPSADLRVCRAVVAAIPAAAGDLSGSQGMGAGGDVCGWSGLIIQPLGLIKDP